MDDEPKIINFKFRVFAYMSHEIKYEYGLSSEGIVFRKENTNEYNRYDPIDLYELESLDRYLEFISRLRHDIEIFKWEREYINHFIMDGEEWEVVFTYKSGHKRSFFGMNEYPDNYMQFLELLDEYDFNIEMIYLHNITIK